MKLGIRLATILFLVISVLTAARSRAQTLKEPVTTVSHVDTIPDAYMPGAEEKSKLIFQVETSASQKDAGMVAYVVLQEIDAPNHFTIIQTWQDAHAYELHVGSVHTVKFRKEIQPFLGSPFDSRVHRHIYQAGRNKHCDIAVVNHIHN